MFCHDPEVMGLNPGGVKLRVCSPSVELNFDQKSLMAVWSKASRWHEYSCMIQRS